MYTSLLEHKPSPSTFADAYLIASGLKQRELHGDLEFNRLREMSPLKICREMLYHYDNPDYADQDDTAILTRAFSMSGGAISDIFQNIFDSAAIQGTAEILDSTQAIAVEVTVNNFQTRPMFVLRQGNRLELLPKGGTAAAGDLLVAGENWRVHRYAKRLAFDERDLSDDMAGVIPMLIKQQAVSAGMMRPDLIYAMLLSNPTIVDFAAGADVAVFDATYHKNYATTGSALADTTLQAGMTAIGNQHHVDANGNILHVSQRPHFLIVPHELTYTARHLAREISLGGDDDLEVIPESRLGPLGLTDPLTGNKYVGSTKNWLLAARPDVLPSIVVGYLFGQKKPRVRKGKLPQGQYGLGVDINLDIGVTMIDYRQLYFATGAGA